MLTAPSWLIHFLENNNIHIKNFLYSPTANPTAPPYPLFVDKMPFCLKGLFPNKHGVKYCKYIQWVANYDYIPRDAMFFFMFIIVSTVSNKWSQ